jgi:regulatory protein
MRKAAAAKPPSRSAFASALRRLSRRDHSEQELRRALAGEGHTADQVDEAVSRVKSARYVDDKGYAERFTRSRLRERGHGRALIRQGLRVRGVAGEHVDRALKQASQEGLEKEALDAAARKYWRLHPKVEPNIRIQRLWAFLLRRGFPAGLVQERLQSLWPRSGEILEGLEVAPEDAE